MSDLSRRDLLRTLASTIAAAGFLDRAAAAEVHEMAYSAAQAAGGAYVPGAFAKHEHDTLVRLADLIIPTESGKPGAVAAGVPEWIDMLAGASDRLKASYTTGLVWLDDAVRRRVGGAGAAVTPQNADFLSAPAADQAALLTLIAYQRNSTPELAPGILFFTLVRRMTVDGFYTSRIGMRDLYQGNVASGAFTVPQESIDYALRRSGLVV